MAIGDDFRRDMWKDVLTLCNVQEGEKLVVLTGEASHPQNIDAGMRAALSLGAVTFRLDLPPKPPRGPHGAERNTFLGTTPLTGQGLAVTALKQADMVIDLLGLLHSPELLEILAARTRVLMVLEPPEILSAMLPTPDDKRRVMAADRRLRAARSMRITSDAGTDLTLRLGQFKPLPEYGYADEPGHWDHWPSGFISTWPDEGSANGRVVIDAGDTLFPMKMYVSSPVTLTIQDGYIKTIDGGFEAKFLRRYIDAYGDPRAYAVAHVGWGLQARAKWTALAMRDKSQSLGMDARAYYGNFLFSTGPNAEAGGSNNSPCHIDVPMANCSVSLDDVPITRNGEVVAPDQRITEH